MATEAFNVANVNAGNFPFTFVNGGYYQLAAKATWGGGNVKLQQLMPDGATYVDLFGQPSTATPNTWVSSLTADGVIYYYLPQGSYRLVLTTGTALYAAVSQVPLD